MRYLSVCSGIEAATMAWHPLGWTPVGFSEIEKFPSQVLAHHYGSNMPGEPLSTNGVPNYGDFTRIGKEAGPVDLLVGGTPCQSFSVAGKRLGLDDPRGNLALEYLSLARRVRARWIVWENVPGVVSSVTDEEDGDGSVRSGLDGREAGDEWIEESDFATFLSFVRECGYGFAYRVLDAQYVRVDGFGRAVPQRRRRVFLVGYLGDWRRAAAVLLEPQGMRGDSAPRRKAGKGTATDVVPSLTASGRGVERSGETQNAGGMGRQDFGTETMVATRPVAATLTRGAESSGKGGYAGRRQEDDDNLVAFDTTQITSKASRSVPKAGDPCHPLAAAAHAPAIAWSIMPQNSGKDYKARQVEVAQPIMAGGPVGGNQGGDYIQQQWAVRRLTPTECERLQGFPDGFTDIMPNGKPTPDGPRYKALGNSMAVNVMRWIGHRIDRVEALTKSMQEAA